MKRVLVGSLIAGFILALFSDRSTPACLLAGVFSTLLLLQLGSSASGLGCLGEGLGALLSGQDRRLRHGSGP